MSLAVDSPDAYASGFGFSPDRTLEVLICCLQGCALARCLESLEMGLGFYRSV